MVLGGGKTGFLSSKGKVASSARGCFDKKGDGRCDGGGTYISRAFGKLNRASTRPWEKRSFGGPKGRDRAYTLGKGVSGKG